ncbi:MAG: hypothetical protein JWO90_990, partial [Solirubrobacterales bacterium]|nr:hypothetical protein [Solirubrobacterales bacterium]
AAGVTDGPRLAAARRAVTGSADALGQLMASVHGEDAGSRFGDLWQDRATALEAYATAQGADDPAAAATALTALTRVRAGIAGLLDEVDPDGAARPLQRALAAQADAATATVRAIVARSPKLGPRLLDAARASREVGRALVVRFATRFPKRFPAS